MNREILSSMGNYQTHFKTGVRPLIKIIELDPVKRFLKIEGDWFPWPAAIEDGWISEMRFHEVMGLKWKDGNKPIVVRR